MQLLSYYELFNLELVLQPQLNSQDGFKFSTVRLLQLSHWSKCCRRSKHQPPPVFINNQCPLCAIVLDHVDEQVAYELKSVRDIYYVVKAMKLVERNPHVVAKMTPREFAALAQSPGFIERFKPGVETRETFHFKWLRRVLYAARSKEQIFDKFNGQVS